MTAGMLSLELLLMIGAGIFARKSHIVGPHFNEELASLITKLALPCLIVDSMRGTASLSERSRQDLCANLFAGSG